MGLANTGYRPVKVLTETDVAALECHFANRIRFIHNNYALSQVSFAILIVRLKTLGGYLLSSCEFARPKS
jgi:hypothetical protein